METRTISVMIQIEEIDEGWEVRLHDWMGGMPLGLFETKEQAEAFVESFSLQTETPS